MANPPSFDLEAAHRFFSANCFNRAWDLMDSPDRSREDGLRMLALSQASIFHWMNRPDVTDKNLSVGYWQASRVLALLGQPAAARWLADVSFSYSHGQAPFLRGYAYEGSGARRPGSWRREPGAGIHRPGARPGRRDDGRRGPRPA